MVFRSPSLGNDIHLSAPTSADAPFDTAPYHLSGVFFGPTAGFDGTLVAPNIVLTAGHVANGIPIGTTFTSQGVTHNVIEKILPSVTNEFTDVMFLKTDGNYPDWAWMWNNEPWTQAGSWLFMVGHGLGRGPYGTDGVNEWWEWGLEPTRARRWGATRPYVIDRNQGALVAYNRFRMDNDPACFACTQGDSGSGVFIDAGPNGPNKWLYLGVVHSGSSGAHSNKAIWDRPNSMNLGFSADLLVNQLPQILSLGGRVLPSSITITKPAADFVLNASSLLIEGTTTGNPSKINVQLTY